MDNTIKRPGLIIIAGSIIQLVAAFLPDQRVFTSPDPAEKLQAISTGQTGWILQCILFPVAFLLIATGFGLLTRVMQVRQARFAAICGTILSLSALLFWLPVSAGRLQVSAHIDEYLLSYQPGDLFDMDAGYRWSFWVYTLLTLVSIAGMALALALERIRRITGLVVAVFCLLALTVIIPLWKDWPPLLSYVLTLVLGAAIYSFGSKAG